MRSFITSILRKYNKNDQVMEDEMDSECNNGEQEECVWILVGKPEGKRPIGRTRHRWEVNSNMNLREIICGDVDWIYLPQDMDQWRTPVNTAMNFMAP
jgi:hypothetical protein